MPFEIDSIVPTPPTSPEAAVKQSLPTASEPIARVRLWRLLLAALLVVMAWDWLIYQSSNGRAAWGAFLLVVQGALLLGCCRGRYKGSEKVLLLLIGLASAVVCWRSFWQWNDGLWLSALALAAAFSLTVQHVFPWIEQLFLFLIGAPFRSSEPIGRAVNAIRVVDRRYFGSRWAEWIVPIAIGSVFIWIFLQANPDTLKLSLEWLSTLSDRWAGWLGSHFFAQLLGWIVVGVLILGWIVPPTLRFNFEEHSKATYQSAVDKPAFPQADSHFRMAENTLVALCFLFVIYLISELNHFWFREIPDGFPYSAYAHRGAAWLTFALAVATVVLSVIFQPEMQSHPKNSRLRGWAWCWSFLNLLLALSVYNRMWIYVEFNGMTRMRILAYFGITCVLIGFLLVVAKIIQNKSFGWLIQRQLMTLMIFWIAHSCTPQDWIAYTWNRQSILQGDLKPSVQITVHTLSSDGFTSIVPLVDCENEIIREGVRAMLAQRFLASSSIETTEGDWRNWRLSEDHMRSSLQKVQAKMQPYLSDPTERNNAIEKFRSFAYRWY
ncbi:MAG: DUF4153 domain-containing protein [Pirellula sp.]|jgi:hypothetical protein|nr:DUF4173 domain-containing protein [Pirellula sp.]